MREFNIREAVDGGSRLALQSRHLVRALVCLGGLLGLFGSDAAWAQEQQAPTTQEQQAPTTQEQQAPITQEQQAPTNEVAESQPSSTMPQEIPAPKPLPEDGPAYLVDAFELLFLHEHTDLPTFEELMEIKVELGSTDEGYVAPRDDVPLVTHSLAEIAELPPDVYYASAIQRILEIVRDDLVARTLMGVFVAPHPDDISEVGSDLREEGNEILRIIMTNGVVTELRSLGSGDRIEPEDRINNPLHERILLNSPIRPHQEDQEVDKSLLRKDELDRYVFYLGRHPGRRVDVSVAAAVEPGMVALDYLITENNPVVLYAQISNTGTASTDRVRERFGFMHTQLTNNDDIFSFDFVTAGFDDDANALSSSYEAPFGDNDRIRWRLFGTWSEFTADQVGFANATFTGTTWQIGAEAIANIYQDRELFLDFFAGVRLLDVSVDNQAVSLKGDENFVLPSVGLRMDRTTEWFSTRSDLALEFNLGGTDDVEVTRLGRTTPDDHWVTLRGNFSHSFYLEPVFDREAWEDPTTPESSTLAHEITIDVRWQYAFNNRLIPQAEAVAGGLYTIRGHPESAVAGDNAIIARFEYRYHVPRAFAISPEPKEMFGEPFRSAPQHVYGRPDWDLILKGFFDVGRVSINDRLSFESNETLVGTGLGVEFLYKRNFNVRLDWGFALRDVDSGRVNSGSNRLHVVATILF